MIDLLQHVPIDRLLLLIFVAGGVFERFKSGERSRRAQGQRLGDLETRVAALEASKGRG